MVPLVPNSGQPDTHAQYPPSFPVFQSKIYLWVSSTLGKEHEKPRRGNDEKNNIDLKILRELGNRDPQQLIHAKPPLMKTIWCTLCCSIPALTAKLRRHLASMRIQLPVLTTIPARRGWTKWATNEATKRSVLSLLLQHTQAPMNYIYSWNFATIYRLSHHLLTFLVQIFWQNRNPASWQR